ncbi:MAG: UbiA family prenyltransferase [Calditrichia bacterium]
MKSLYGWLHVILELGKARIAQFVTLSTTTGYVLAKGRVDVNLILAILGVFILAMGSGALNQYQERKKDALMSRTRGRPIPSGKITSGAALAVAFLLLLSGSLILFWGCNQTAGLLGLLTVVWYNGVYTYLKRLTSLAVVPGAVIGSLPPLIGWAAAGGNVLSTQAAVLAIFFFIWQIPHFWLLLLKFGNDYEKAGYPTLTTLLKTTQLGRLTFVWIVATASILMVVPLFGITQHFVTYILLFLTSLALIGNSLGLVKPKSNEYPFLLAFRGINIFILVVMILLSLDRLLYIG